MKMGKTNNPGNLDFGGGKRHGVRGGQRPKKGNITKDAVREGWKRKKKKKKKKLHNQNGEGTSQTTEKKAARHPGFMEGGDLTKLNRRTRVGRFPHVRIYILNAAGGEAKKFVKKKQGAL